MNNAANLKLSIIICTYNRIDLLQKCITSLLPQLNEKVELIIIDNNSTDNTQDICQNYAFQYNKIKVKIYLPLIIYFDFYFNF